MYSCKTISLHSFAGLITLVFASRMPLKNPSLKCHRILNAELESLCPIVIKHNTQVCEQCDLW